MWYEISGHNINIFERTSIYFLSKELCSPVNLPTVTKRFKRIIGIRQSHGCVKFLVGEDKDTSNLVSLKDLQKIKESITFMVY